MPLTSYIIFNVLEKIWLDLLITEEDIQYINEINYFFLQLFVQHRYGNVLTISKKEDILSVLNDCRKCDLKKSDSYFVALILRKLEKFAYFICKKKKYINFFNQLDQKYLTVKNNRIKIPNKTVETLQYLKKKQIIAPFYKKFKRWAIKDSQESASRYILNHTKRMFQMIDPKELQKIFQKVDYKFYQQFPC